MATKRRNKNAYTRLATNKDFELWFGGILEELCAFEQGLGRYDDFVQGKRAAGSYMIASFKEAGEAGRDMMARIYLKHFGDKFKPVTQEEYK